MSVRKKDADCISLSLPDCKIKDGASAFPLKWNNKPGKKRHSSTDQGQCVTKILRILKTTRFNKVWYNLEEEAQRRRSIDKVPLQI